MLLDRMEYVACKAASEADSIVWILLFCFHSPHLLCLLICLQPVGKSYSSYLLTRLSSVFPFLF